MEKMKRIATFLLLLACWACKENDPVFDIAVSSAAFEFKPIAGGAVMHYKLPANADIYAVEARYRDYSGKELTSSGTYANDSLIIYGFKEAAQGVPVTVTLMNFKRQLSDPIHLTFDTYDSGPIVYFNNVQVKPSWDGFMVITDNPQSSNGMAHIFYLGTNPLDNKLDTLEVKSMPITPGKDTLLFPLQQKRDFNTIFIRTSDVRGYRVKQVEYKDVEAFKMRKAVWKTDFEFLDTKNKSIEDADYKLGIKYLFDGDTKGVQGYKDADTYGYSKPSTFLAGPDAVGAPFIVDLKTPIIPASCRFYAFKSTNVIWPSMSKTPYSKYAPIWNNIYITKLPCKVYIYGSNDMNDNNSWVQLRKFEQDYKTPLKERWMAKAYDAVTEPKNLPALEAADPVYLELTFSPNEIAYRYLKIVVTDVFYNSTNSKVIDTNPGRYVSFHELEVFVKE